MSRPICLIFSLIFFSVLLKGQSWEQVALEDFSGITQLSQISNLTQSVFSISGNGATGASTDTAAVSGFFYAASGAYMAFRFDSLDSQYEYRLKCNAKSVGVSGRKLQFRYNTQAGPSGTNIGTSIVIPMVSSSSVAGGVLTSQEFSGLNGQHYLILAPDSSNPPITPPVYIDDFTLEKRLLSVSNTTLTFATSSLSVDEGQGVEVCVNITDPSSSQATTVEVALDTSFSASPHFDGFSPPSLTFPADSSGQQCFTLQTDAYNGIAEGTVDYTFILQNLSGGNNPQVGSPGQLVVTVIDDPMDQTINFPPIADKVATTTQLGISATATSGYAVQFTLISGPASISGNLLTFDGVIGTIIIEANQPGDGLSYNAAPPVRDTFEVIHATQTINFSEILPKVITSLPFTPNVSATSGLPVTISLVSGPATVDTNLVTLTGEEGIVVLEANQSGDSTYSAAPTVQRSFDVTAIICDSPDDGTFMSPGDLIFIGFDNDVTTTSPELPLGSDRIILTNLKAIEPCTQFSIYKANYFQWSDTTAGWITDTSAVRPGYIPSQLISYEGSEVIPIGSLICFDLPSDTSSGGSTLARNFYINGVPAGEFIVANNGRQINTAIDIVEGEADAIYIMQGSWKFGLQYASLFGRVISALALGTPELIPPDLECAEPPVFPTGSLYGYFDCSAFGSEFTQFDYLDLANDTINWQIYSGNTTLNDLGPLSGCESACDVIFNPPITILAGPSTLTLDCSSDVPTAIYNWAITNHGGVSASTTCAGGNITITSNYDTTSHTPLPNACTTEGSIILFYVQDDCGNLVTVEGHVVITDTGIVPYFSPPPQDMAVNCSSSPDIRSAFDTWFNSYAGAGAADDCDLVRMDISTENFDTPCSIMDTIKAIITIRDACGNMRKDSAYFYIVDDTPPSIITPPANDTLDCSAPDFQSQLDGWLSSGGYGVASDSCSAIEWVYSGFFNPDTISCGNHQVYFRATDACGNLSSLQVATLYIIDTIAPEITETVENYYIPCNSTSYASKLNSWLDAHGTAQASDNCSSVSWSHNFNGTIPISDCGSQTEVIFTATDDCGNVATVSGFIEIIDEDEPEFTTLPTDLILSCADSNNTTAIATWLAGYGGSSAIDNCDTTLTWSHDYTGQLDSATCGQTEVYFVVEDDCGSISSASATILIEDNQFGITNQGTDLQLVCSCEAPDTNVVNSWLASAAGIQVSSSCSNITVEHTGLNLSSILRCQDYETEFTFTNSCGEVLNVSRSVTFNAPPCAIAWDTLPQDIYVSCGQDAQQIVQNWVDNLGGGVVSGTCIDTVTHNYSLIKPESCDSTGQAVTFTAIDTCGVLLQAMANIFLAQDTIGPVLQTTASDTTYTCNGEGALYIALNQWLDNHGGATATDNCGYLEWSYFPYPANLEPDCSSGNYFRYVDVTFTASDPCGNSVFSTAQFKVIDDQSPTIVSVAQDTTLNCNDPSFDADFQEWITTGMAEITDNCAGTLYWSSTYNGALDNIGCGSTTVTFTAMDAQCAAGNSVTTSATLTIVDDEVTLGSQGNDLVVNCDGTDHEQLIQGWLDNNANAISADCSALSWINDVDDGTLNDSLAFWQGIYNCDDQVVTFTATDACGNQVQFNQSVTFVNNCSDITIVEQCINPVTDIIFVVDNSSLINSFHYSSIQQTLSGLLQDLDSYSGLDFRYAIVQAVREIDITIPFTTNPSLTYSRAFDTGTFDPEFVFEELYDQISLGSLAPRQNCQLQIVVISDSEPSQYDSYDHAFSLKSPTGLNAEITFAVAGNADTLGNAAAAVVASRGGSYTDLVNSISSDPAGPGTLPRKVGFLKVSNFLPMLVGCGSLQAVYNGQCNTALQYSWATAPPGQIYYTDNATGEIFINGQGTYSVTITCPTGCTVDTTHSVTGGSTLSNPSGDTDDFEIEPTDFSDTTDGSISDSASEDEGKNSSDGLPGIRNLIRVFPNPTSNEVFVHINSVENQVMQLHIFDPAGRLILRDNTSIQQGDNQFRYDLNVLPSGVYMVRIQLDQEVFFEKLTVIRK